MVTGQLADTPTRGLPTRGLDNSRTSQLADWTSRGLDNLRSRRCRQKRKLSTQSRRWHPRVLQSATCPVHELSSPRVDQSARCPVRESSSPRVGNPRLGVSASCLVTVLTCDVEKCFALDASSICLRCILSIILLLHVCNVWRVFSKCSFRQHSALYPSFRRKNPHRIFRKLPLDNFPHSAKYPFRNRNNSELIPFSEVLDVFFESTVLLTNSWRRYVKTQHPRAISDLHPFSATLLSGCWLA